MLFSFYCSLIQLITNYLRNIIINTLHLIILTEYQFLFSIELKQGDLLC